MKKPHIIIFNPDEMRSDSLSHLGNPASVTPNLDAFTKEGVSFRNAYCQNPVCVPSRCSFFTGLYPHVNGHRTMAHLLHPDEPNLFGELKDAGYYVWMNDRNDLLAGQIEGWAESQADEIFYGGQKEHKTKFKNPGIRGEKGNKYFYSHYEGQILTDDKGKYYSQDDEIVDAAIERIHNRPEDKPLCMFLGLIYPHVPYQVEEPYFSMIDRKKLEERVKFDQCHGKARIIEKIRENLSMGSMTEEEWDEIRAVYLGMCAKVDDQFGRLIDALKEEGIYDDCAIFFLSDHGDFTGDYDLVEKAQNSFEDCLTKVPFLIKPPKGYDLDPGISDSLVELVDFYATAMDMAGVEPNHTNFGKSLKPLLADRTAKIREYAFSEGGRRPGEYHCDEYHINGLNGPTASDENVYWPKQNAQSEDLAHAKGIMITDGHYKYVSRNLGSDEFYDLLKDPKEKNNLIEADEYKEEVMKLQIQLMKWLQDTDDVVPYERDARFTPKMLWARVRGFVPKDKEEMVKGWIKDGMPFQVLIAKCRQF